MTNHGRVYEYGICASAVFEYVVYCPPLPCQHAIAIQRSDGVTTITLYPLARPDDGD